MLEVQHQSSELVLPLSHQDKSKPTVKQLSILDSASATFGPCGATWFLDPHDGGGRHLSPEHLKQSLRIALDSYPQLAGQLGLNEYKGTDAIHAHRYGRVCITHGASTDPGVDFHVASYSDELKKLVPDAQDRAKKSIRNCDDIPAMAFVPLVPLASPAYDEPGTARPSMCIQVTTFSCGGLAIAIAAAHCLSDVQSLCRFMCDWGSVSRALLAGALTPQLDTNFDPAVVDAHATGDIDAATPLQSVIDQARALPLHRYDWWASGATCPIPFPKTQIPALLKDNPAAHEPVGDVIPWHEIDGMKQCTRYILHFSKEQIDYIWACASKEDKGLSKQDAILAHVWCCINAARRITHDKEEDVYVDLTIGLRPRLSLPDDTLGSPVIINATSAPSSAVDTSSSSYQAEILPLIAGKIRSTLRQFTASAVGAQLHSMAYDTAPQRIARAILSRRHIFVTSWVRCGGWNVDFGAGTSVRYIDPIMGVMDGMVSVLDCKPSEGSPQEKSHWTDGGVDMNVHLNKETMERLVENPVLLPAVA